MPSDLDRSVDEWMEGRTDGRMDERIDGWMYGQSVGRTDGWIGGSGKIDE